MSGLGNKEVMARNIKLFMDDAGETQRDLAKILGVSKSTVNDWCTGKNYPRIDKIELMAYHWHILKSDLVEDKMDMVHKSAKTASVNTDGLSEEKKAFIDLVETMSDEDVMKLSQLVDMFLKK